MKTQREWLQELFEDVRRYFRYEAEPEKQKKAEKLMRETMRGYMDAREHEDFDEET